MLDGRAEELLRDPRALAALGQARFPLRGFHPLGSRPLPACALAVAFAEPRDDPPGAELDHAWSEGRPQYSQQASECVGFDSPMARPICNLCFPSLLLAGKASGVGMASGHAEGGTGAARGHPMAFRHASTGRPLDCPLRPSGRLEVYAVDLRLPPFESSWRPTSNTRPASSFPHCSDNASRVDSENLAQMRLALEVGGSASQKP